MKSKIIVEIHQKDLWRMQECADRNGMTLESLLVLGGVRLAKQMDIQTGHTAQSRSPISMAERKAIS